MKQRSPRVPLSGSIDLTYRCNNNCRHCWIRIPPGSPERRRELTFDEIRETVDAARSMGCRRWCISGGEPMLRPDFGEVFDYITRKSASYSLNTNGTLITPETARLLKRKGTKMVALYGATAEVYEHITRTPGSFDAAMRGFAYLKEAGAGFVVQIVPMRDNYHQLDDMVRLAESLSPHWRLGAVWLYLSGGGDPEKNREISRQRLDPQQVIALDRPNLYYDGPRETEQEETVMCCPEDVDDRVFAACIAIRRDFHVDPYGRMSFCGYVRDPALRYDLRKGTFRDCWEEFIPSLADEVRGGEEYRQNCGSCRYRSDCPWCPVYAYLEHGRFSAPIQYLCDVARENRRLKDEWVKNHRRYYQCAGVTIQVDSDYPIDDDTFHPKFRLFQVDGPGEDTISIRHHSSLPDLNGKDLGEEVYRRPPWAIYRKNGSWIYLGISSSDGDNHVNQIATFTHDHTMGRIYHNGTGERFRRGDMQYLTLFPSDQILLARVLADRQGCYFHSAGVKLDGKGLLFVGHSEAGKSTISLMLKERGAQVLCDDRVAVRRYPEGPRVFGTWSHGDVPDVSADSVPLEAILFLEKSRENRLVPLESKREIVGRLLGCLVKPLVTADWWEKELALAEYLSSEVPCYVLRFDKSGAVVDVLRDAIAHGR